MTQPSEGRQVLVVGLGNMGSALAEALISAGWRVTGWNRTAGKSQALRQKGVSTAGSVAEAASAADVTIVCVSDHAATEEIIFNDAVGTALNDKLLVQLSTINADQSRETAAWAEAQGIAYLEGSILGLPADVTGYFGDHDPSGKDISRNIEDRLHEFAPGAEIHFRRVAVTEDHAVFTPAEGNGRLPSTFGDAVRSRFARAFQRASDVATSESKLVGNLF